MRVLRAGRGRREGKRDGDDEGGGHEFGDAIVTAGDEHGWISVISVAENRVVGRLNAHPGSRVVDADGACARDGFVVSVGEDGFLKAWDVFGGPDGEGECVGTFDVGTNARFGGVRRERRVRRHRSRRRRRAKVESLGRRLARHLCPCAA